jgi:hypothetical protein
MRDVPAVRLHLAGAGGVQEGEVRVGHTTAWPSPSRQRATHSLSVGDSRRMGTDVRVPSVSAKRRGSVQIRGSICSPLSQDPNLTFLLVYVDANMVHG